MLLGSKKAGKTMGLKPRARIRAFANIGSEPVLMLTGPVDVTEKLLKRAKMKLSDIDLVRAQRGLRRGRAALHAGLRHPHDRINVNGGAIAMGHPLGATGAMIFGTVLDELERRDLNTALVTLCIGAGMGTATIIERVLNRREEDEMTYKNFTVETDADGIALVTWDMPDRSMNVFTEEVMDELEKIIEQVAADAAIKGAVITSGKDSFSGGADIDHAAKRMLGIFHAEKAKDRERAIKLLFDGAGRMGWSVAQAGDVGKPWVVGDQRHLHGRRVRAVARLPWPRRGRLRQGQDGAARGQGRHLPGRRRHPARAEAGPDQQRGAADADHPARR